MTDPDYRALCAELVEAVLSDDSHIDCVEIAHRARALAGFDRANIKAAGAMRIILNRHAVDHARAAIAKYGTPAAALLTPEAK